ncbi:hypothetical protein E4U58_003954 [Claviceps cyperi]|nr:hypothetical protein E4U58_003954 [Claviceps cyperi]
MDTPSHDYDSESLSYQTGFYESDDAETSPAEAFSEYTFDHVKYPDEVLEEEACRANRTSRHCHPGGASEDAPSEYAQSPLKSPDHIFKQVLSFIVY